MGVQALHRGGQESPTGEEAVPWHGGGIRRDQRRAENRATAGGGAHQGAPQGLEDEEPSSLDGLPTQGERGAEDVGGRHEREAEEGGGFDCNNLQREGPGTGRAREGGHHGLEILRLCRVSGRRGDQGETV